MELQGQKLLEPTKNVKSSRMHVLSRRPFPVHANKPIAKEKIVKSLPDFLLLKKLDEKLHVLSTICFFPWA